MTTKKNNRRINPHAQRINHSEIPEARKPSQTISDVSKSVNDAKTPEQKREDATNKLLLEARPLKETLAKIQEVISTEEAEIILKEKLSLSIDTKKENKRVIKSEFGNYAATIVEVDHDFIVNNMEIDDRNVRKQIATASALELSDIYYSIASGYQINPIIAYKRDDGKVMIIDGGRRARSAELAGIGAIVQIFEEKPSPQFITWLVSESDKKRGFSPYERGIVFSNIMRDNGWEKQSYLTEKCKYDKTEVSKCLGLLKIHPQLKAILPTMNFSFGIARDLLAFDKEFKALSEHRQCNIISAAQIFLEDKKQSVSDSSNNESTHLIAGLIKHLKLCLKPKKQRTEREESNYNGIIFSYKRQSNKLNFTLKQVPKEHSDKIIKSIEDILKKIN